MESSHLSFLYSKIALSIKVAAILIIVLAIYYQDLTLIANEATQNEVMSYILAIPILFIYILYRKRKMIRAAISFETLRTSKEAAASSNQITGAVLYKKPPAYFNQIVGTLVCLTAFLLYWHGSYTFYPLEYHMISLPIFISGIILAMFNTETLKALAFPIALLIFLTPPPLEILNALGSTLSTISSESAYTILKVIGLPVTLTAQYGNPVIMLTKPNSSPIAFTVDVACAGLYSLIGFTVFATFIAYITKAKFPKKAMIFLAGIPLMFTLNIARVIIIVVIGNQYGKETAFQAFHLLGGWSLILIGSILLTTMSEKIFKIQLFTTKQKTTPCNCCSPNQSPRPNFCIGCGRLLNLTNIKLTKRDSGKIFVLVLSAILILNIQVPVFALTEGPVKLNIQTLSGEQTTKKMLPEIPGYTIMFYHRDKIFEEQAKQDASLIYTYYSNDTSKKTIWAVIELAKTRASMHPWEVCLITWQIAHGYQPQVRELGQRDIHVLENPPITARFFSFKDLRSDLIQVILYWYESSFFNTGSSMEREYTKISFVAFAKTPEDVPSVEDQLLPFGKAMVDHWLPIKSWSLVALLISQNGMVLIAITMTVLALALTYQTIKNQKQKNLNLKAYNKLVSEQEKLILQAVHKAAEESKSTGNAIAKVYQKLTGKNIETKLLLEELGRAEEAGFMKRDIGSQDDEPVLVWKTQIPFFKPSELPNLLGRLSHISFKSKQLKTI